MPREERRLAAIMALDMVGYSRQMETDEAGIHKRLKAIQEDIVSAQVQAHSGRIFKAMGDGFMAEFSSALDAVECAVSIQNLLRSRARDETDQESIEFRIGINLGDIIVDGGDALGDSVNIASRIESIAPPGGFVCLQESIIR
ncbi:MAG: adenylate cyclase [Parasphingorhabdus sp.]